MKSMLLLAAIVALSACASAKKTYTPDGRIGYTIDCSGAALNWGKCFEKAGKICGSKGYDILERSGEQGDVVSANQYGAFGGSVIYRTMVIACKPVR
jgi:hypothetical protein